MDILKRLFGVVAHNHPQPKHPAMMSRAEADRRLERAVSRITNALDSHMRFLEERKHGR